jgi:hypothetical protein
MNPANSEEEICPEYDLASIQIRWMGKDRKKFTSHAVRLVTFTIISTLLKQSSLIAERPRVEQINKLTLFKFTDELGDRLQTLLENKKADSLTSEEIIELESIEELDETFGLSLKY